MRDILDVAAQRGQHALIFGERGVGKTSLASVMSEILSSEPTEVLGPRANCDGSDDFSSIWRKITDQIEITQTTRGMGFSQDVKTAVGSAESLLGQDPVTPDDVRRALQVLGDRLLTTIFIDEFDRVNDDQTRSLFADTIKALSDNLVPATLVLVGVADDVSDLIRQHQSVERALVQIRMPRMSPDELEEVVARGLEQVNMTADDDATARIARLSLGLPHYTHLLGLWSARSALVDRRLNVHLDDVNLAIDTAIEKAQHSIMDIYHRATFATRDNIYPQVLLACALAETDDLGYFAAADVRQPLSQIMGRYYDIPTFARHLNALSESDRGPVLQKKGAQRKFRYRFINPLLKPYITMKGLASGIIKSEILE
jgi:Cdc6-like AAA superfamily ATPase